MKRPILYHPDPRLKKSCAAVEDLTDDLRQLADDMLATMYDAPGVGLAAPQVGVLNRLIVLDCVKEEGEKPRPLIMFNPKIVAASEELNTYEEGCLSIPEQFADVTRPAEVEVTWIDRDGNEQREGMDGLVGDMRAARDRPSGRQAVHRLSQAVEAPDDHAQNAEIQARACARMSVLDIVRWPDPR